MLRTYTGEADSTTGPAGGGIGRMGNKSIIPTTAAGAGTLVIGLGMPKLIEGLPIWVSPTLVGVGVLLLLIAAGLRWFRIGGNAEEAGTSQTTSGDSSPTFAGNTTIGTAIFGGATSASSPEARRRPGMPIWSAIEHVRAVIGDDDHQAAYLEARRQIRQAASDGRLRIWGRQQLPPSHMNDPHKPSDLSSAIPADYWSDFRLAPQAASQIHENAAHTEPCDHLNKGLLNLYWDLRVDSAVIKKEWPRLYNIDVVTDGLHRVFTGQTGGKTPDMPLAAVLVRIYKKLGPAPSDQNRKADFYRSVDRHLGDEVHLKNLSLWGRLNEEPLRLVRNLHTARFDHRNDIVIVKDGNYIGFDRYYDLRFCRAEVDEVWPDE